MSYVFLWTGDHNCDRFLFLLVVLVSTEHRRQLAFSHLLDSLFTCRHPSPQPTPSLGSTTTAKGVTHLLMRAAIDSSLTPGLWGGSGGQTGWSSRKKHLPTLSRLPRPRYHATARRTRRHNIYTVRLFSACASNRVRGSQGAYTARRGEKAEGRRVCVYKYISVKGWLLTETHGVKGLWKHGVVSGVGTFSYPGDVKCSSLKSLFVDVTHSRLW